MPRINDRFKSPISKVIAFLEKSRDRWKKKHQELKEEQRAAKHQMRALESSRQKWRERAEKAEAELKKTTQWSQLPSQLSGLRQTINT